MTTFVPKERWSKLLHGWTITDCAVRSSGFIYLVARENIPHEQASSMWDHDIPTRFLVIYLDKSPEDSMGGHGFDGFNKPLCGVARKPLSQGIIVARNSVGQAWAMGSGQGGPMEQIDPNGGYPMTQKIKCIDDYAYSVGRARSIYKRIDLGKWVKLDNGFPDEESSFNIGFYDMDGFSETDMYAVGGKGDIWHYDGTIWMQEGFPSNMQLNTVTCAGDGYVYVSGMGGTLWRGRNSTWEHLYDGSYTVPWNDVLWFEDKLWLASDYMLRIWNGKELMPVTDEKGKDLPFSGHMDAYDGLLVIADTDTVMAYQNGRWRTLVAPYE